MHTHPLTGEQVPWQLERPGHHCGCVAASENVLLLHSGFTAFCDLIGEPIRLRLTMRNCKVYVSQLREGKNGEPAPTVRLHLAKPDASADATTL